MAKTTSVQYRSMYKSIQSAYVARANNGNIIKLPLLLGTQGKITFLTKPCHGHAGACPQIQASRVGPDHIAQITSKVDVHANENQLESLVRRTKEKLVCFSDGEINPSAYDTAWVARIKSEAEPNTNKPQFPMSLDWICENQLDDGSWGESSCYFLSDRLVNTLACVLALRIWETGERQMLKGVDFLRENMKHLDKENISRRTTGFELVFPWMLDEAKYFGLDLPYGLPCLKEIIKLREMKIKRIPLDILHSQYTTLLFTLEGLQDVVQWDQIMKFQSRDGSFLSSPAATAVVYIHTRDKKCLDFLTTYTSHFGGAVPCQYPFDLMERIFAVDAIQRLGIDHHFPKEISDILDYVYKHTGKHGVSWGRDNPVPDIDDTSMALRLLRLHGYPVSSANHIYVLENFRDEDDDNFVCFPGQTCRGVSDMFNLYRWSQIAFPGEKILKEAKVIVEEYLTNCVKNNTVEDKWSLRKSLTKEVQRALNFPWRTSFNRLEVREYIDRYGAKDVWIGKIIYWMYNVNNPTYLELAKLDYNWLLSLYKKEINSILQWWNAYGFELQLFDNANAKETHFAIAATLYEPEFSDSRVAYTKLNFLENLVIHLFEKHESDLDITLFSQAVEKWDPQLAMLLPVSLKVIFRAIYDTLNEMAVQISNAQGRDMFTYLHQLRVKQIKHYKKRREHNLIKSETSFNDHMEGCQEDLGIAIRLIPPMFLLGDKLREFEIRSLDESSIVQKNLASFLALFVDIQKHENKRVKQEPNAIYLWAKGKACTEQEALSSLHSKMEEEFDELVHEVLKPGLVSRNCRRLILEHARIVQYFKRSELKDVTERKRIIDNDITRMFTPIE